MRKVFLHEVSVAAFCDGKRLGLRLGPKDLDQQKAGADDDAAIGNVEVRPVVVDNVDLEEVDNVVIPDAVVEIAESSAENESERNRGECELTTYSHQHAEENNHRNNGEGNENIANRSR